MIGIFLLIIILAFVFVLVSIYCFVFFLFYVISIITGWTPRFVNSLYRDVWHKNSHKPIEVKKTAIPEQAKVISKVKAKKRIVAEEVEEKEFVRYFIVSAKEGSRVEIPEKDALMYKSMGVRIEEE